MAPDRFDLVYGAEALLGQRSGVGNYAWRVYQGMVASPSVRGVHLFANLRWLDVAAGGPSADPLAELRRRPRWRRLITGIPGYVALRQSLQGVAFRRSLNRLEGPVVYHEPNYVLRPFDGPTLTTVHDLGWIHAPQHIAPVTRRWLERGMPDTLARATRVITVSAYVAREITEILGVPASRISITPLGVREACKPRPQEALEPVLGPLDLSTGRYILSVSTVEPRKNLSTLLRAFARMPSSVQQRFPLVLVGAAGWGSGELLKEADPLVRRGLVRPLGYVDDATLVRLYSGAACLAMPSRYEGFGLPILEAMASGTAVVTSDRAAMAEVAGDAAVLVDPDDEAAVAAGLEQLVSDDHLRCRVVRLGLARAELFNWDRTVALTLDAYRSALAA